VDSMAQVHAMVTGPEHLRPDVPADIGVTPGGTFGGITAYLELMRACWAQVSVMHLACTSSALVPHCDPMTPAFVLQTRDSCASSTSVS
jgi:hypothetical protein